MIYESPKEGWTPYTVAPLRGGFGKNRNLPVQAMRALHLLTSHLKTPIHTPYSLRTLATPGDLKLGNLGTVGEASLTEDEIKCGF